MRLCSRPYHGLIAVRAWLYRQGWLATRTLPVPVISIGNLTVGGTGKTPIAIWVATWLASQGWKVGILSRGYRRSGRAPCVLVSNFEDILVDAQEAGDEPYLLAKRCPGVCVAVGADRFELGRWVLGQCPVEVFVLDDGFQHLGVSRNLNILVVDVTDREGMRELLPAGRLREPVAGAERASAFILTRVTDMSQGPPVLNMMHRAVGRRIPHVVTRFEPVSFIHVRTGACCAMNMFSGKQVLVLSGIGNPASFRGNVEALGLVIVDEIIFPDHYPYSIRDMEIIRERARHAAVDAVVTTEKDAVKMESMLEAGDEVWAMRVGLRFLDGQRVLETLMHEMMEKGAVTREV